jgi:hypothetical protein
LHIVTHAGLLGSNNIILLGVQVFDVAYHFLVFSDVMCLFFLVMYKIVSLLPELKILSRAGLSLKLTRIGRLA